MEYVKVVIGTLILIVLSGIAAAESYNHKKIGEKQGNQEQENGGSTMIEADVRKGLFGLEAVNSAEQTQVLVTVTTATDNSVVIKVCTVHAPKKILDAEDKMIQMDPPETKDSSRSLWLFWPPHSSRLSFALGFFFGFCLLLRLVEENGP